MSAGEGHPLRRALEDLASVARSRSIVCIFSDLLDLDADALDAVRLLGARGHDVTVVATGFGNPPDEKSAARPGDRPTGKDAPRRDARPTDTHSPYLPANLSTDYGVNIGNINEIDIPTYLRRQMD